MRSTKSSKRTNGANASEISAAIERARHIDPLVQDFVNNRKDRKLTQQQLNDMAGVSRRTIVLIEAGGHQERLRSWLHL
jgi:DNA-binding XRE family transcriptional regulator